MNNIIIPNPRELKEKEKAILYGGKDKLHVISDFDRTLTKAFVNGEKFPSIISILRAENYLTPDYSEKSYALKNQYSPIEIDNTIPLDEKKKSMYEWWTNHFNLLIESKLNIKDIQKVVESKKIQLRGKCSDLLKILNNKKIPLVIMSASGLGTDSIKLFLEKEKEFYSNIQIISNGFKWDGEGYAIGIKKPIIHVFNKDEASIPKQIHDKIKNRKNVILLGDSLGDLGMISGFDYDNLIKIGFLNEDAEKDLEEYKKNYDVVILNDGDMSYVNKLIKKIN
ncbi:MAG: hypothetical protein WC438_00805 [Candidatus Pacearchaeota archaeon]